MINQLEPRRLLASVGIVGGVLTVNADGTNDIINIAPIAGGKARVTLNGGNSDHTLTAFTGIRVNANAGNDKVMLSNDLTKPATLIGGAGNDSLVGGGGNDIIDGGTGGDTVKGGGGNDTVDYSARTAKVTVGLGTLSDDGEANEHDNVATDIETILGGSAGDNLKGAANNNRIEGRGGNDTLIGLDGNDTLDGGLGSDALDGGAGNDRILGGTGNDTITGGAGNDSLSGNDGDDSLFGGDGNDTLAGGNGIDTVNGGGGTDTASNDGWDIFIGVEKIDTGGSAIITPDRTLLITGKEVGDEIIIGGYDAAAGQMRVTVDFSTHLFSISSFDRIVVNSLGGGDGVHASAPSDDRTHHLTFNAGDGNDYIECNPTHLAVEMFGGAGDDSALVETFGAAAPEIIRFDGGSGVDFFESKNFNVADDFDMNATMPGVENARILHGRLVGNALDNTLEIVTEGTVMGGLGNDVLRLGGSVFNQYNINIMDGGDGNDTLAANPWSGASLDMRGGAGNDLIQGGAREETLDGGAGDDTLRGGDGNDLLRGGDGYDQLEGNNGNDILRGGNNNDRLFGGNGNDHLFGEAGDDLLFGQNNSDTLDGGVGGNDRGFDDGQDTLTNIEQVLT